MKIVRLVPLAVSCAVDGAMPANRSARRQATAIENGVFVVLAGTDTLFVERFTRTARELTGSIETRVNGRTSRATYSVLRDPAGRPRRLESSLTVPQRGLSTAALDIVGDSVVGPLMLAERESFYRGSFASGSLPLLSLGPPSPGSTTPATVSLAMAEDVIAAASGDSVGVPVLAWGVAAPATAAPTVVRRSAQSTFAEILGGVQLDLDGRGHIVSGYRPRSVVTGEIRIRRSTGEPILRPALRAGTARADDRMPPMGWNSWNRFGCRIDEQLIRETADAMVRTGMLAAGYRYLNIDDCWEAPSRNAAGDLVADSTRFPSGMKALVDYIHAKGLKAGIYSSGGTGTCQRRPASLDHEGADARRFAAWGFDYLKYDNCNAQGRPEQLRYRTMIDAVRAAGREMVFSVCEWGEARPWLWASQLGGDLWRTTEDIRDSWMSMTGILDQQVGLDPYAGPGAWNDPDMLEVGNGRMTHDQYVAHFSLWALLNAPLIAGNDLRTMTDSTRAILLNSDVIAVDQDWFLHQGFRLRNDGTTQVWAKPMSDGGWAIVLLNRGPAPATVQVTLEEVDAALAAISANGYPGDLLAALLSLTANGFPGGLPNGSIVGRAMVHDLWTKEWTPLTAVISRTVPATGAVMLRIQSR